MKPRKLEKKGAIVDYKGRKFDNKARKFVKSLEDSMAAKAASEGVAEVDYESTLDISNENGVSKTEYRSVGNISDDRGKAQRIVENKDGKTSTSYARKSKPTTPVKVGPSSPSKIMANFNSDGEVRTYRDIEKEVRPGISNPKSVSDLEKAKKMTYKIGGKIKKYLIGGQVELDKNKDGKISSIDFKMLKKK